MVEFNLQQDYFDIFQLEPSFRLDLKLLSERYRQKQRETHPDRFAAADERQQRIAVQYSALVNQAFETLSSPVLRARYLLLQRGVECPLHNTTFSDPEFLMQQMELREQLSELRSASDPESALDAFNESVEQASNALADEFERFYLADDNQAASDAVAKMQFLHKLSVEAEQIEADLLDY